MKSLKLAVTVALIAGTAAMATSKIEFIVATGGDNNTALYESGQWPVFTPGVGPQTVDEGQDVTWSVRVLVHGEFNEAVLGENLHSDPGGPGDNLYPQGAANLVFDLVLKNSNGDIVAVGAGGPGVAGFHSTINDGDADGARGQGGLNPDPEENAAFASAYDIGGNGGNGGRLIDAPSDGGPNFDYFWHPSADGYPAGSTADPGYLVGFGAGYKDFDFGVNYIPGVGIAGENPFSGCGLGLVEDPQAPQVLFEGQINTTGLVAGNDPETFTLEVVADATGNNILHGAVDCNNSSFGAGSFATKVNEVIVSSTTFTVNPGANAAEVKGRMVFYNQSFYDGNSVAINPNPVAGNNNDDDNAIDTSKSALLPGAGAATTANYTPYDKGINGVMFDIANAAVPITQADFTFVNQGRLGTGAVALAPSSFLVRAGQGVDGSDRVVITFANGSMLNGWLQTTIGTGFGLPAADVSYWGNAAGDGLSVQGVNILVDGTDIAGARDNGRTILNRALVDNQYDFNKNSLVDGGDIVYARDNQKTILNSVRLISR